MLSKLNMGSGNLGNSTEVVDLMNKLRLDLREKNLDSSERLGVLSQLKNFTRTSADARPLFNQETIEVLCQHGFDGNSLASSREALKCLANIFLHESKTRQMFVEAQYAGKAAERLKSNNLEDELLSSRILFFMTYETNLDFTDLFETHDLARSLNKNIARHSEGYSNLPRNELQDPINVLALSETLKLLFNLTQYYPQRIAAFSESITYILNMICHIQLSEPPLQPPLTYLINSLINLNLENDASADPPSNPLFPASDPNRHVTRLIKILDVSIRRYREDELETLAPPLVTILRKIYFVARSSVQHYIQTSLLPSIEERAQPLGRSDSLPSRLLRLSTSPVAPNLRESVSSMLFECSDQDPTTFVRNVGYGFASGFLITHNLAVPEGSLRANSSSGDDVEDLGERLTRVDGLEINPVTGQRKDKEPVISGPAMTDEEKEIEAEKLFVLFERLRATGVVDVPNPVGEAIREGRFKELD